MSTEQNAERLRKLLEKFEPGASGDAAFSIAVSLKRIADALEKPTSEYKKR